MNIVITGSTGYIGTHLSSFLMAEMGDRIIPVGRDLLRKDKQAQLVKVLSHCDTVIHLAGTPMGRRWTSRHLKEIYESRVAATACLVEAMRLADIRPKLFISVSAVGYYPSSDGRETGAQPVFDEYTRKHGDDFVSSLCMAWEHEAQQCPSSVRLVIVRLGVVLSPDGGAMYEMLKPVRRIRTTVLISSGTQPFPWIGMYDLCRAVAFLMERSDLQGVFNLVAPDRVMQKDFARIVSEVYKSWWKVKIPRWALALRYGKAASFLAVGQHVRPARLLENGFEFSTPTLDSAVRRSDHSVAGGLNIASYMGLWYEIARFDHRFERGLSDVMAIYTLRDDGKIVVENSGCRNHGGDKVYQSTRGIAFVPDVAAPRKLRVSFFPGVYTDYRILELDEKEYAYALVGSNTDDYLWILSRTPQLPDEGKRVLLEAVRRRGYDATRLLWIEHS